ncbi:MAG: hypothetical protein M3Y91_02625 [Actinomycetota bacterium]|nr:hypothetical protein [Actinomycetota bacterium]
MRCRGREYLRIIYGPEYTAEANLSRLRSSALGHKRSLAWREFALGIEALERFVAHEPALLDETATPSGADSRRVPPHSSRKRPASGAWAGAWFRTADRSRGTRRRSCCCTPPGPRSGASGETRGSRSPTEMARSGTGGLRG